MRFLFAGLTVASLRTPWTVSLAAAAFAAFSSGCGSCHGSRADGRKPLPSPRPDAKPADYQPALPFEELAPNVFSRAWYRDDANSDYSVVAQELAIPPSKIVTDLSMPGSAVFQLREGKCVARVGGQAQSIEPGGAFAVAEGVPLTLENQTDAPLFFRVHVLKIKPQK